jgi:peptide/nickel transport system substrate-binding protein
MLDVLNGVTGPGEPSDHRGCAPRRREHRRSVDAPPAAPVTGGPEHDRGQEANMDEHALRVMVDDVKTGRLSRRRFIESMVRLGLTAPMAAQILGAGIAAAQPAVPATPARRGGGGPLKLLYWQAPTSLNPHLTTTIMDIHASRIFYESLAHFDRDGNLVPRLAIDVPTVQNGGLAADGTWVTWTLKRGVTWHDGRPFTASDVIFTWQYAADPATAASSLGTYRELDRVEKVHDHAVKFVFKKPTPFWAEPALYTVIPRHVFEPYVGSRSREAPANLKPVGTGAYRHVEFKPGDSLRAERYPGYHLANQPFFDTVELKGGGDAVSAARAVLQTGEYDYAWNLQMDDDVLQRIEQGGRGRVIIFQSVAPEFIECNFSDPRREVDGERASVKAPHPFLTDPAVRTALNVLVDRGAIQEQIYGRLAATTANILNGPVPFVSPNTRWEFNLDKANQILDSAGWKRGADGVRAKDGNRLHMLFQTSVNGPRQKTQQVVKQACGKAGIELELKSTSASSFFTSDPGNPDTYNHFFADLQMRTYFPGVPDPQRAMEQFTSWRVATKENKWTGGNKTRWRNEEYDRLWRAADTEMDAVKRAALFIRMNDLVIQNAVVIPILRRHGAEAVSRRLRGYDFHPWAPQIWNLAAWYQERP